MFYTLCGDKVSVNPYIPTQTMKEIKATICNHQADSPPYVACGLIWWFANLERYNHSWHRMSLLRLGVIKQSQPKLNMYERTHQFARVHCVIRKSHCDFVQLSSTRWHRKQKAINTCVWYYSAILRWTTTVKQKRMEIRQYYVDCSFISHLIIIRSSCKLLSQAKLQIQSSVSCLELLFLISPISRPPEWVMRFIDITGESANSYHP